MAMVKEVGFWSGEGPIVWLVVGWKGVAFLGLGRRFGGLGWGWTGEGVVDVVMGAGVSVVGGVGGGLGHCWYVWMSGGRGICWATRLASVRLGGVESGSLGKRHIRERNEGGEVVCGCRESLGKRYIMDGFVHQVVMVLVETMVFRKGYRELVAKKYRF